MSELTNATAVAGTPALLNLLTTLTTVLVPVPAATGTFVPKSLNAGDISYGKFLFASALTHTTNTGFNFAPARDVSEAVFWNPAALSLSRTPANISLLTNVKNNGKLSAFTKITNRVSLGAGAIYTRQDEFRDGFFTGMNDSNKFVDSMEMDLKEYAIYVSPSFRISNKLSVGFAAKSVWQRFNIPVQIVIQRNNNVTTNEFTYADIEDQYFDFDVSLFYQVTKWFQVGFNAMNLTGTESYADAFFSGQQVIQMANQRSYALGLSYKYQRFNFGADLLFTDDDLYDASIGINVVPFNEGLISAGYAFKQSSYSLALRLKHFRLAYIHDNDFFANEKRKGRSGILDGKIYGGFSFNF